MNEENKQDKKMKRSDELVSTLYLPNGYDDGLKSYDFLEADMPNLAKLENPHDLDCKRYARFPKAICFFPGLILPSEQLAALRILVNSYQKGLIPTVTSKEEDKIDLAVYPIRGDSRADKPDWAHLVIFPVEPTQTPYSTQYSNYSNVKLHEFGSHEGVTLDYMVPEELRLKECLYNDRIRISYASKRTFFTRPNRIIRNEQEYQDNTLIYLLPDLSDRLNDCGKRLMQKFLEEELLVTGLLGKK